MSTIIFLINELRVCLLTIAESFGNEEGGIRKSTRVEASELKEGQRTVLRKLEGRWRAKRIKNGQWRWSQFKNVHEG